LPESTTSTRTNGKRTPMVRMDSVSKSYGQVRVLNEVSLDVARGEIVVVIGASGSGKTTLLRCLIGLVEIDAGLLEIDGQVVVDKRAGGSRTNAKLAEEIRRKKLGMVFQQFNLFPHMTALQNVIEAPVHVRRVPKKVAIEEGQRLLQRVGLLDRKDYYPSHLSGGQQQRVAIARALAMKPELILFDEVTSALDPELTGEVLNVMVDLAKQGQAMIVVTHEMGFAREVAHRVVFIDEGKVLEQGSPARVLGSPEHPRTRQFLSKVLHMGAGGESSGMSR
jgi:polar amino acid transport system ATP-binding protein